MSRNQWISSEFREITWSIRPGREISLVSAVFGRSSSRQSRCFGESSLRHCLQLHRAPRMKMDEKKDVQKSKMRTRLISKCKYCTISTSYYIVLHSDAIWMSLVIAETWGPIGSRIGDMTSRFANVEGFSADKSGLWSFTCTKEWTTQDSENDRRIKRVFFHFVIFGST